MRTSKPAPSAAPRPGAHAFVILEAKAVAWDFSLDGNLFRDSHRVTREPWVAQAAVGVSSQWLVGGRGIRLALMRVWRTRAFREQADAHAIGSVAVSVELLPTLLMKFHSVAKDHRADERRGGQKC